MALLCDVLLAVDRCQQHCRSPQIATGRLSAVQRPAKVAVRAVAEAEQLGTSRREDHKLFDEAVITVRSGAGGNGEVVAKDKGKMVPNFKYRPRSSTPKQIWLPAADPAQGADGGDVVLYVDPALDNLLHLHERSKYTARNGANGDPSQGSGGPHRKAGRRRPITPPVQIGVPSGTLVRRKRGGQLLGELLTPGQQLLVARGGQGGDGVVAPKPGPSRSPPQSRKASRQSDGIEVEVEDRDWKGDARGMPGQEATLELLMRLVADIGFVGLPNAGKSSLLAKLTRAAPEIAAYPFTTLMPNLGVMPGGYRDDDEDMQWTSRSGPVLADLPGLIDGAHKGRGLGRMFLRHLRRTAALLHVVDGASDHVAEDYRAVREELRLYNPEYCLRPHIVALNKLDMVDPDQLSDLLASIEAAAIKLQAENFGKTGLPAAVVPVSAVTGQGVSALNTALDGMLRLSAEQRLKASAPELSNYGLDW